jgi:hypothetical protein
VNTWKVILATLVIFGTGVVTGGLLVTHSERVKQRQQWMLNRVERNRPVRSEAHEQNFPPPGGANPGGESGQRQPNLLPSMLRMDLLQRIERQIDLTTGQREKIEEILREGQEHTRQIMEPVQPELQKQMRTTRERIREVLTEEQQRHFDELMRPPRRTDESLSPERRMQRQQFRPQDGQPRFPGPGPRNGEPANPAQ